MERVLTCEYVDFIVSTLLSWFDEWVNDRLKDDSVSGFKLQIRMKYSRNVRNLNAFYIRRNKRSTLFLFYVKNISVKRRTHKQ